jgi:sporadic carbohydrate cluster protein (TIGR04323 family)
MSRKFRGYIFSREVPTGRVPQHIQNLVVRSYAERMGLHYLLSGVEYRMANSFLMLNQIAREFEEIDGIILYSMFLLPQDEHRRKQFYLKALENSCEIHAAVENLALKSHGDVERWEKIFIISQVAEQNEDRERVIELLKPYAENAQQNQKGLRSKSS